MNNKNNLIVPFLILGLSIIIGVFIFVSAWKSNQSANQTITVTGSAKKEIVSDLGFLRGTLMVQAASPEYAFRELNRQKPVLLNYLKNNGFQSDKVEFFTMNNYPVYEIGSQGYSTGRIIGYVYNQRMQISSEDVNKIKEISLDIASLVEQGINFNVEMPEYHYTKLAELKIEIQAEAAKDAMVRAQKIAEATGRDLGPMRTARMGVLQITPKFSNVISDYGINDLSSIEKEIIGVVNASFEIE
ncbi:MAG TPA: SIMPL domain-containing protein [Ignavibacteriaceae bacterium]|nr:SIMPL domain-containing protein [Ignavibacteriaceae bacterium]